MAMRVVRAYERAQKARPLIVSAVTGFTVMSIGDASVQLCTRNAQLPAVAGVDVQRNMVSSAYNGAVSPLFFQWYRWLDSVWPGVSPRSLVRKVVVNQIAISGLNSPLYLTWCATIEAWLLGAADWEATLTTTRNHLVREVPSLMLTSICCWMPINVINFGVVPPHLRILYISSCGVAWTAFLSFVAHREPASPDVG